MPIYPTQSIVEYETNDNDKKKLNHYNIRNSTLEGPAGIGYDAI